MRDRAQVVETKQGAGAGTGNGDSKEPMNHRSYFQKPTEITVYLFSIDFGKRENNFFFFARIASEQWGKKMQIGNDRPLQ